MAKILIVDDSNLSRRILRRILESAGHQVIEAEDGLNAVERYAVDHPDLVLLDMTMRGMHGLEVLGMLRAMDAGARVIVATADIQRSTRTMAEERGGVGFIAKPFDPEQVLDAVSTAEKGESNAIK